LLKIANQEEKLRATLNSLHSITEVAHLAVDAMNTVAKELSSLRAINVRDSDKKPVQLADQLYRFVDMLENVLNTTSRIALSVPEAQKQPTPPKDLYIEESNNSLTHLASSLKALQKDIVNTCA